MPPFGELRLTQEEWAALLMEPGRRLSLAEFQALETYYAAGAALRAEQAVVKTMPHVGQLVGEVDVLSVWMVEAVRRIVRHVPLLRWLPLYPHSLVGRMDLKEAQAVMAMELERRREIIDGARPHAEMLAKLAVARAAGGADGDHNAS